MAEGGQPDHVIHYDASRRYDVWRDAYYDWRGTGPGLTDAEIAQRAIVLWTAAEDTAMGLFLIAGGAYIMVIGSEAAVVATATAGPVVGLAVEVATISMGTVCVAGGLTLIGFSVYDVIHTFGGSHEHHPR